MLNCRPLFSFFIATVVFMVAAPVPVQSGSCLDCLINDTTGRATCLYLQETGANDCTQSVSTSCNLGGPCPSGGGKCFLAGTMISTPSGLVPIETLTVGDIVIARDASGGLIEQPVTRTYRALASSFLKINGKLRVTDSHPFLVNGQWTDASDLSIGDRMRTKSGASTTILSIEYVDRGVRVYNIEVGGSHTFFANGTLVHNKTNIQG